MDINFSCLTRWRACETQADILPAAWNEATAEVRLEKNTAQRPCSPEVVRVLSRESTRVVIGTVAKVETFPEFFEVTVRLEEDLKPGDFRLARKEYSFAQSPPMEERPSGSYVVFFAYPNDTYPVDHYSMCSLVAASAENMEVVRRGLAEDWADRHDGF